MQGVDDVVGWLCRGGQESADFVTGQPDQAAAAGLGRWFGGGHDGQERMRQERQGAPALPGDPGPDLVFVEGGEFFAGGEGFLDAPAASGHFEQGG